MQGIVIKSTGSWYQVRLEDGEVLDCRVVGKLRLNDLPLTNPIAVGDEANGLLRIAFVLVKVRMECAA